MRKVYSFNQDWQFHKGELQVNTEDGWITLPEVNAWDAVQLPHTWNNIDGQDGGDDYFRGEAWYQKVFKLDAAYDEVYIRFGAVSKKAEVWCNGRYAGVHEGGFSSFILRLTPYLRAGENVILVKADNSRSLPIYPMNADFTFFGGIYREAELLCFTEQKHFEFEKYGADSIYVTPSADGKVQISVTTNGSGTLHVKVLTEDGSVAANVHENTPAADGTSPVQTVLTVQVLDVHVWNGTEDAYLYKAQVSFTDNCRTLDEKEVSFGFRTYSVNPEKGFFLNGAQYPLHGVCRHQDREDMGWALTENEHLQDMALIREMGANTIRLAHYQQAPFFYDLCDRNGMVVWAEIPFISVYDTRTEADENLRIQMRELVMQNYNHPSICFWGIANEIGIGGESERMYEMCRELEKMTKELDPTRLTTIANVGMTETTSPLFHITDVTSYNEYQGWYEGSADKHGEFCDRKHAEMPDIPLAISEYGADCVLSWHNSNPKVKDYTEEYQAILHEKAEFAFEKREYLFATWLWNMFDFAADNRCEGGCKGRNNKGIVTYDRKTKKQAFYFYKACWSKEPFVYICGKRYLKRSDSEITVKVYSNRSAVTLTVNGKTVGTKEGRAVFEFEGVKLSDGYNELLVRTPDGLTDTLILEKVEKEPESYTLVEVKDLSDAVTQWFASLTAEQGDGEKVTELIVNEGFLSVYDPLQEVYEYPEGYQAVQDLVAKPLSLTNPGMAERMKIGGAMSFHSIWNHISKFFPDEVIILLNERLNKIEKKVPKV